MDGAIYYGDPASSEPLEQFVLVCGDEERVIYQLGDEIPFCSEEMEAYYKALDEANDFSISSVNRRGFDFEERANALWDRVEQIRKTVPEWQCLSFSCINRITKKENPSVSSKLCHVAW